MKRKLLIAVLLVFCTIYPIFANSAWLTIGATFFIFSLVALSQDIVLGRAGVYDMGHAIYFGMGGYIFAILVTKLGMNFFAAAFAAVFLPALLALAVVTPVIHLRGDYFLVVSIGLNFIFTQILNNNPFRLTGGPNGIFGIFPAPFMGINFSSSVFIYYFAFIVITLTIAIMNNFDNSRYGRAFYFIYQDDLAAASMGINASYLKQIGFMMSAVLAGFAGVLYALEYSAVSPETFSVDQSITFFAIVIVGGQGSLPGVLLGTFAMFVLPELFRGFADVRYLIFGIAMVAMMVMRPRGLMPTKYGFYPKKLFGGDT
ncbi:MAG: branched-chain amino acid ABC transporter permease [Deferribacteraceae bacterium]|jgi:branched-chain amino acid transport system permease protein|nr:branched-chain amino acid ABC transporter permease [Deferribacteraceae bacterium]